MPPECNPPKNVLKNVYKLGLYSVCYGMLKFIVTNFDFLYFLVNHCVPTIKDWFPCYREC